MGSNLAHHLLLILTLAKTLAETELLGLVFPLLFSKDWLHRHSGADLMKTKQ